MHDLTMQVMLYIRTKMEHRSLNDGGYTHCILLTAASQPCAVSSIDLVILWYQGSYAGTRYCKVPWYSEHVATAKKCTKYGVYKIKKATVAISFLHLMLGCSSPQTILSYCCYLYCYCLSCLGAVPLIHSFRFIHSPRLVDHVL